MPNRPAIGMALLVIGVATSDAQGQERRDDEESFLFELTLEELLNVRVASATLTETDRRHTPAAVTTIEREDIAGSGARTLNELLQIHVPGLQLIRHHFGVSHLGTWGIISDKEDKYLMLVNGRVMNERTQFGAMSERDLMLLSDIQRIEVIRGPGAAVGRSAEATRLLE